MQVHRQPPLCLHRQQGRRDREGRALDHRGGPGGPDLLLRPAPHRGNITPRGRTAPLAAHPGRPLHPRLRYRSRRRDDLRKTRQPDRRHADSVEGPTLRRSVPRPRVRLRTRLRVHGLGVGTFDGDDPGHVAVQGCVCEAGPTDHRIGFGHDLQAEQRREPDLRGRSGVRHRFPGQTERSKSPRLIRLDQRHGLHHRGTEEHRSSGRRPRLSMHRLLELPVRGGPSG